MKTQLTSSALLWWDGVPPLPVNEDAVGPKRNPLKEFYWKQSGGGPNEAVPAGRDGGRN